MHLTATEARICHAIMKIDGPFKLIDVSAANGSTINHSTWHNCKNKLIDGGYLKKKGMSYEKTGKFSQLKIPDVTKHKPARQSKKQAPEAPPAVNLSPTADDLANSVSALIRENAHLRETLLKLHNVITNELQLDKE